MTMSAVVLSDYVLVLGFSGLLHINKMDMQTRGRRVGVFLLHACYSYRVQVPGSIAHHV
jgi:hypothetical protein